MADRTLRVNIIGDERDLLRAFGSSARGSRQFQAQMTGASRSLRNVFAAAGVALGATAIVQAFRSTISAAIDFESSFAGVRKTVDATEPQLKALAEGFRGLAREIPVSVDELNRIGEAAGQLGIKRKAILDFTRTVADLGATTNLASDEAANALARLANITGLPQDEFDRLGSTIVDLGNKLAATESEIVELSLRMAGAGRQIGLTEAQITGFAGALASVGVNAEAGGSAFSRVFATLANDVAEGGKTLDLFAKTAGTTSADFKRQFGTDAAGAVTAFVEGLARVERQGGNVFAVLKDLGLGEVRVRDALLRAAGAQDLFRRSQEIAAGAWRENIALTEEAAKRYQTTAARLQIFENRVTDLKIVLGEQLVPTLTAIVEPLSDWLAKTENQERVQKQLNSVLRDSREVFEGVRAVVVPLAEAARSLSEKLGGLRNTVKLLLTVMVVSKVVNFGTAITGLGTAAATSRTQVRLLQTALFRLGAIGVITLSIEFLTNYETIQKKFTDLLRLGPKALSKEPIERLEQLREKLERTALFYGRNSDEARKYTDQIAKLNKQLGLEAASGRPEEGTGARDARIGATDTAKRKTEAAVAAAAPIEAGAEAKTAATKKAIASGQRDSAALIAAEKREQEALRASRRRAARISSQFEALGLTSDGQQRAPGVGALRGRLANLRDQLKGTALDTDKTRSQLAQIARVLKGEFGAAGRDVRLAILDMFNQIASGFKEGSKQTEGSSTGEITRGGIRSTQRLLRGLDLSEEERRLLQQRNLGVSGRRGLSAFGFAVTGEPGRGTGSTAGFGGGAGGAMIIHNLNATVVTNDTNDMMKKLQKKARRSSGGRRGRHGGANLGMQ